MSPGDRTGGTPASASEEPDRGERLLDRSDLRDRLEELERRNRSRRWKIRALWIFVVVCGVLGFFANEGWIILALWPMYFIYALRGKSKAAAAEISSLEAELSALAPPARG